MSLIGILCGCPFNECSGSVTGRVTKGMTAKATKVHRDRREARNCYINYLLRQGYTRTDNASAFLAPEHLGGHVQIITKLSHFGGELMAGKERRYMHRKRSSGSVY